MKTEEWNQIQLPWPEWKVTGVLGRGTFGEVYEAHKQEGNRVLKAAVKVLKIPKDSQERYTLRADGFGDQEIDQYFYKEVKKLEREIVLMEELQTAANIVSIKDSKIVKQEEGYRLFMMMELLTSLDKYFYGRHPVKTPKVLDVIKIGCDICDALSACEKRNIIHRDIKPSNIFVSEYGDFKLGDFGVSRQKEYTQANMSVQGTVNYMAPEVYLNQHQYDHTVDIYSLSLVLYRLLNRNRLPFVDPGTGIPTFEENSIAVTKRVQGRESFPDPLLGGKYLAWTLKKACSFRPEDRYQSAEAFKNDLLRCRFSMGEDELNRELTGKESAAASVRRTNPPEKQMNSEKTMEDIGNPPENSRKQPIRQEKKDTLKTAKAPVRQETAPAAEKKSGSAKNLVIGILCGSLVLAGGAGAVLWNSTEHSGQSQQENRQKTVTEATPETPAEVTATEIAADPVLEAAETAGYPSEYYPDAPGVQLTAADYNEAAPDWTEYDNLIQEIKTETDTDVRAAKMHQAEDLLMATAAVLPLYQYNSLYLQKSDVEGIYTDIHGIKYFRFAETQRENLWINVCAVLDSADPALIRDTNDASLIVNLFAGLFTYEADGRLAMDLCESYSISEDGLKWTFSLRDGLRWSDGSALTAEDFAYAWKRAADPKTDAAYGYLFDIFAKDDSGELDVTAEDDTTLTVRLNAPCAYLPDLCAFPVFFPVPKAQVEADADGRNAGTWASEAGFLTNGAYSVSEWVHLAFMTLKKNEDYHRAEEVSVRELEMTLSDIAESMYTSYLSGTIDLASFLPAYRTNISQRAREAFTSAYSDYMDNDMLDENEVHVQDILGTYYVEFNVNSDLFRGKTVAQAVAMRKAISLLIDRQDIAEAASNGGAGRIATSFVPAGMADGDGGIFKTYSEKYTYPLEYMIGYYESNSAGHNESMMEEVRGMLEFAGYEFDSDGKLSAKTPLSLNYLVNEASGNMMVAELMRQDLAQIGIDMTIERCDDWDTFLARCREGDFDLARGGWIADFDDPINLLELFASESYNNDTQLGVHS
ncbi:MAG: ABC transporter substrate-binding protein [Eubacteriales bacterium]|nr:ABC transporter substrate-binding protein [Eubacteriales bacterium]